MTSAHRPKLTAHSLLRWTGFIGMMSLVLLRMFVLHSPQTVFDVDPTIDPNPLPGLGLGGSLMVDVFILFFVLIAIAGEYFAGRGLILWLLTLALLPGLLVMWHGSGDIHNLRVGLPWLSAAVVALVLVHLARDVRFRAVAVAVLLAAVIPLLIRGVGQITWEHRDTIRAYEGQREAFLSARGWELDSASAQMYERRLRQPQPLGWFTTSNVFASVMLVGVIVFVGWSVRAWKARMDSGWPAMFALLALACATALFFTGSKGAMGACGGGLGLMAMLSLRAVQRRPWLARSLIIGMVFATLGGVILRGQLPENFANDRSLLFRWHYMQASRGMVADHPWAGVGPDHFQSEYTRYRVPRNPEEVSSAHSVYFDWLATLGRASIAWIVLTIFLVARTANQRHCPHTDEHEPDQPLLNAALENFSLRLSAIAASICLLAGLFAMFIESSALDGSSGFLRFTAVLAMAAVAALITRAAPILQSGIGLTALASGAAALLAHGQIELTFTQPGTAAWGMGLLAVSAAPLSLSLCLANEAKTRGLRALLSLIGVLIGTTALTALLVFVWNRGVVVDQKMEWAAHRIADTDDSQARQYSERCRIAIFFSAIQLAEGSTNYLLGQETVQQCRVAASLAIDNDTKIRRLQDAAEWAEMDLQAHHRTSSIAVLLNCRRALAHATNDPADWNRAIEAGRLLVERDPNGLAAWNLLADTLWDAGRIVEAKVAYRRVLECDAAFELDPLKQLSQRDRIEVENRSK